MGLKVTEKGRLTMFLVLQMYLHMLHRLYLIWSESLGQKKTHYTSSEKLLFSNSKMREHYDLKNFSKQSMAFPPFMSWFSNWDSHFSVCLLKSVFVKNASKIMNLVAHFQHMNLIYMGCDISQYIQMNYHQVK